MMMSSGASEKVKNRYQVESEIMGLELEEEI